jgi:hypothetical protein
VKLFLFRTKLQDCFFFVKKNFVKLFLRNWLQMHFPPLILSACMYEIVLSFRAIIHILKEGKVSLISFGGTCCLSPLAISLEGDICRNKSLGNLSQARQNRRNLNGHFSILFFVKSGAEHASIQSRRIIEEGLNHVFNGLRERKAYFFLVVSSSES